MIFTGGIVPTAWRPITSYGAIDLPTYFLDLTPFVPVLTDGQPHNISLDVVSAEDDHTINQNWFVSGSLQVVTDPSGKPTTGKITQYNADDFAVTSTTGSVGDNGDVNVTVAATRNIHIEAEITSGSGETTHVVWSQSLQYSNTQNFLDNTFVQVRMVLDIRNSTAMLTRAESVVDCESECNWIVPLYAQWSAGTSRRFLIPAHHQSDRPFP